MTGETTTSPGRLIVDRETRPKLPPYLKLRHDAGRGRWVLLAPERVLTPDQTAVAVLQLCDGTKTVEEIAAKLRTFAEMGVTRVELMLWPANPAALEAVAPVLQLLDGSA